MKKTILFSAILVMVVSLMSFDNIKSESIKADYSFTRSQDESPLIKLQLNEDNTFEFIDLSNPNKIIDTKGKYTLKGNRVKLYDYDAQYSISNSWRIDSERVRRDSDKSSGVLLSKVTDHD